MRSARLLRLAVAVAAALPSAAQPLVTSATISQAAGGTSPDWCLNFQELLLFNNKCQLVSALAIPGVSVSGSAGTADSPLSGGADLMLGVPSGTTAGYAAWGHNPYTSWGGSGYLSATCSQGATWTVTFPATTVSQAMLVTRQDGTNNPVIDRPIINRYNITLRDAAGAVVDSRTLWSNNTVIMRSFPSTPYLPVAQVLPNPVSVAQLRARDTMVRYVRLSTATSTTGTWLHIKEMIVFDDTWTNVLRNASCVQNTAVRTGNMGTTPCSKAGDMTMDFDDVSEGPGLFSTSNAVNPYAEYDLGGSFNVTRVIVFNRWHSQNTYGGSVDGAVEGPRLNGGILTFKNWYNDTLLTLTLPQGRNPFYVVNVTLPLGLSPNVPSQSASATPTPLSSPSAGASGNPTATPTPTATGVPPGGGSLPARLVVASRGGAPLDVVEVMAFTPQGKQVASAAAFATAYSSGGPGENPGAAIDGCVDGWVTIARPCPFFESLSTGPARLTVEFAAPVPISQVMLYNRAPTTWSFSQRWAAARPYVELYAADGSLLASWNVTTVGSVATLTTATPPEWPVPVDPTVAFQADEDNQLNLVRYVQLVQPANAIGVLSLRELMVFDETSTNVAAGKSAWGTFPSAVDLATGATYVPGNAFNMVIDDPELTAWGDLYVSSSAPGNITVDLGGVFNVKSVYLANRGGTICSNGNCALRMAGARLLFLNTRGWVVGSQTLTAEIHQTYPVTLLPYSSSPTPSPISGTPTSTPPGTRTSSSTASPSATLSAGAAPSTTPSGSATGSNTRSASATPSQTPSPTGSALLPLPASVRVQLSQPIDLNIVELLVIGRSGRLISAPANGGVATSSSVATTGGTADRGVDLLCNATSPAADAASEVHTGASGAEWFQVAFPPQDVAKVILVNRADANQNLRLSLGNGVLTVRAHNGTDILRAALTSGFVQEWALGPPMAPAPTPNPSAPGQTEADSLMNKARYVAVTVPPGAVWAFRELHMFSASGLDLLSHGKSAVVTGAGAGTAPCGTNGQLDFDSTAAGSDAVWLNATGSTAPASYTLDLGGLYGGDELGRALVWYHRYRSVPVTAAGPVTLQALNAYGWPVFTAELAPNIVGAASVSLTNALLPPSATPSPSGSPTNTPSVTASPSGTPSVSPSPSVTASGTRSPSATRSPTSTPTPSVTATLSVGASPSPSPSPRSTFPVALSLKIGSSQCLSFMEVLVFDTAGRLISPAWTGATAALSAANSPATDAPNGNDFCFALGPTFAQTGGCTQVYGTCNASLLNPAGDASWNLTFAPELPLYPAGKPRAVSRIIYVNRVSSTDANMALRPVAGRANVTLYRVDGSVAYTGTLGGGSATTLVVGNETLPSPGDPDAATPDAKLRQVRYVRITAAAAQFLHFKEAMLLDGDGVNVLLRKPAYGSPVYTGDPSTYTHAAGNDGVVDSDAVPLNLYHSGAAGGYWEADLQGMFTPTRLVIFNRATLQTRLQDAAVSFMNYYRTPVGSLTLSGDTHQHVSVTLFEPTGTPTGTGSPSPSQTPTTSQTGTPSPSGTGTATKSGGATASITSSVSLTASITASPSVTPPITPSASGTPFSLLPATVRIDLNAGGTTAQCLNLRELFIFGPDWRLLSAPALGGVGRLSSIGTYAGTAPSMLNDLQVVGIPAMTQCTGPQWAEVAFRPAAVSSVVFLNRIEFGFNSRISSGGGTLTLVGHNGSAHAPPAVLTSAYVQQLTYAPFTATAPVVPNPAAADQTDPLARTLRPRYVRLAAPSAGVELAVREVLVLDGDSWTNVAFLKSAAVTGGTARAGAPAQLVDGVLDDAPTASSTSKLVVNASSTAADTAPPSVTVDLGGLYNVTAVVVLFDRYSPPTAAHTVTLLNWHGEPISPAFAVGFGDVTNFIASFTGLEATLFPPSATPSPTASPSSTPSRTGSPSTTSSPSHTPSNSPTATLTRTPSNTVSAANTRSPTVTPSNTPSQSQTASITGSAGVTATSTSTGSWTPSVSKTVSNTRSNSAAATASQTETPSPSVSRSVDPSTSATASWTASTSAPPTVSPSAASTSSPTRSRSGTGSSSASATRSASVTATPTGSVSASSSETASVSASHTGTPSPSGTVTGTPSPSGTNTGTPSTSGSGTPAPTASGTPAPSQSRTAAATGSATKSRLPSATRTKTRTASATKTKTATMSKSKTKTKTKTKTRTPSKKKLLRE